MKKLTLMLLIGIVIIPITAFAQPFDWDTFQGTYKMAGSGSCIHSKNGYYDPDPTTGWITAKPGVVYAGTTVLEGEFYFTDDVADPPNTDRKKGTFTQILHATVTPPPTVPPPSKGPPISVAGGIRVFKANNAPFTFKIIDGDITVYASGIQLKGSISSNLSSMTLVSADNVQNFVDAPFWWTICNTARTLIKIDD